MPTQPHTCKYCGKPIVSKYRRFCNATCVSLFYKIPGNKIEYKHTCLECGTIFSSDKPKSGYCSSTCRSKSYDRTRLPRLNKKRKKKRVDDGHILHYHELDTDNYNQYQLNREQLIAKSREKPLNNIIKLSPRTWIIPREHHKTDENIAEKVTKTFKENDNQY